MQTIAKSSTHFDMFGSYIYNGACKFEVTEYCIKNVLQWRI